MSIAEETPGAEHANLALASSVGGSKGVGIGGILAAIVMAFAGFLGTAGMIHAAIRDPLRLHADMRSEKLAMLDEWRGKYFSASFGSSHMHDGFNPPAFDAAMAGFPAASSSVNLAVEGGSQSEQYAMAREFLKHLESPAAVGAPSQPCTVFLELNAGANLLTAYLVHPRSIDIYDWQTMDLISHFVSPEMPRSQRYGRTVFAAVATGLHYANVGMLSNLIFSPPLNEEMIAKQTKDDRRGYDDLEPSAAGSARIQRGRDAAPARPAISRATMTAGNAKLIEALAGVSPARNVSFVYVVLPFAEDLTAEKDYPDHLTVVGPTGPLEVPIIDVARPELYPELYKTNLWYDEEHLDGAGSALFSRLLAEELKKWYAAHGAPPPCG